MPAVKRVRSRQDLTTLKSEINSDPSLSGCSIECLYTGVFDSAYLKTYKPPVVHSVYNAWHFDQKMVALQNVQHHEYD